MQQKSIGQRKEYSKNVKKCIVKLVIKSQQLRLDLNVKGNIMDIKLWKELLYPYEMAVDELTLKLNNIIKEYHAIGEYSPIEMVTGRVKKVAS